MREIRGWNIGETVTAADLKLDTANLAEQIGSSAEPNLPCIYNGLTLSSQSGTGGSIVTFNPGVCRCQDLPLSVFTYLPANAYGTSYPCFIDISTLDNNKTITLDTAITAGYIVATFAINPTTPNAINYLITGSLSQVATGSYDPTHQVRLCSFVYTTSNFTLDFTPGTSRDTDLTGLGGVQWNYENSSLEINTPASQSGTSIVLKKNTVVEGLLNADNITIKNGGQLEFLNTGETHAVTFKAPGGLAANTDYEWPFVGPSSDASPETIPQALTVDYAGNLYWVYMRNSRISYIRDSPVTIATGSNLTFNTFYDGVNYVTNPGYFNTSTGVFTAPIAATYKIELNIYFSSVSLDTVIYIIDTVTNIPIAYLFDASSSSSVRSGFTYIKLTNGQTFALRSVPGNIGYGSTALPTINSQLSISWYAGLP